MLYQLSYEASLEAGQVRPLYEESDFIIKINWLWKPFQLLFAIVPADMY